MFDREKKIGGGKIFLKKMMRIFFFIYKTIMLMM